PDRALSRKAAAVEEGLFLRRGGAAEYRVAVREAAEAADDVGVPLGMFQEFVVAVAACQVDAALLVGEIFRMLERKIEERAQPAPHLRVEAAGEGASGDRARQRIGLVGAGLSAEHVARELIEHDGEGQRALRRLFPLCQRARGCSLVDRRELVRDLGVKRRILLEPLVRPGRAPEREDVLRPNLLDRAALVRAHSRIRPAVMSSWSAASRRTKALRCGSLK